MKATILASGSKGNCVYIEGGNGALLIDAGLSAREIRRRLQAAGGNEEEVRAILVTHEHGDHLRGVDVLARRLDVPVVGTKGTLCAYQNSRRDSKNPAVCTPCRCGEPLEIGDFSITAFQTYHDACDPCGFIVRENGLTFGCCTDTGIVPDALLSTLRRCDALVLESNHCPEMLKNGPYPAFLKKRIGSKRGHLSNAAAAECLKTLADGLHAVVLAHLSEVNNTPEKAGANALDGLGLFSDAVTLRIAGQHSPTNPIEL